MDKFQIRDANHMTYHEFFHDHMEKNIPCLIKNLTTDWRSSKDWVIEDTGEPNVNFFKSILVASEVKVPVADCNARYFNAQEKCDMTLDEYLSWWNSDRGDKSLYLKDWHFTKEASSYVAYSTPEYFSSDWLNEFWEDNESDYKFVYIGPKNSWTPFHSDVFGSYSWSANIAGTKKWTVFPPGEEAKMANIYNVYDVLPESNTEDMTLKSHNGIKYYEIIQKRGEVVFVPSVWYHQVVNVTDALSINHNWFNGTNILKVWYNLRQALKDVQNEIRDCFTENNNEWKSMCQNLLKASHGMNCSDFIELLILIKKTREQSQSDKKGHQWLIDFDLNMVSKMLERVEEQCSDDLTDKDLDRLQMHHNR